MPDTLGMGLIRKNPFSTEDNKPLYTLGLSKTILIVGLGNHGEAYAGTRHNIGFVCSDTFVKNHDMGDWTHKKDLRCHLAMGTVGNTRTIVIKPTTMMNLSGEAVQAVSAFYKVQPTDIFVVYDELDVDFGQVRCRMGGGAAGHNGVKSAIQHIGEDFGRIRVGIGPKKPEQMDGADFVLAKFSKEQQKHLPDLTREVSAILTETIASGTLPHDTRQFILAS